MTSALNFSNRNCLPACDGTGGFKMIGSPHRDMEIIRANFEKAKDDLTVAAVRTEPSAPRHEDKLEYLPGLQPAPDGKVDWTPLAAWTGTRPTVNKYSLERYSLDEWRNHNEKVLDTSIITDTNVVEYNAKSSMMQAFGNTDKRQRDNEMRLKQKAKELFRWKVEVERAVESITKEVELLESERQRLKGASRTLMLPESISKECLDLRSNRATPDLVADLAETELLKEMKLVSEVRETLKKTLEKIEEQQRINKAAKERIEHDWCDKTTAHKTETQNIGLDTKSKTILFKPGATRYADFTAPLEYWEHFCRENILNVEAVRQRSQDLRGTLNAILVQGGRKLRTQADKTDIAIAKTVAITQELITKLEKRLLDVLRKLADVEILIEELQQSIRKMDAAMKLAQTRLDNRNNGRPHGENVRDQPHNGLIEEVKKIHGTVTQLYGQLTTARNVRVALMEKRIELEKDIASKRKTLNTDRDRCGVIRSHYPSASELAGF